MPMKVVYTTINGVVVHENRAGTQRNYRPDTLGNTVALTDATTATDTMTYWPYGEIRTRTGTNATRFLFVGTLGYSKDGGSGYLHYVRARYYQASRGRWATVDPLWPQERAYGYVKDMPQTHVDPSGLIHPALLACLVSGGISFFGNLVGGDPPGVALCKAAVSCLVAAILALILPVVGVIAGCLIAAAASLLGGALSRLCEKKPPCSGYTEPDKVCAILSSIIAGVLGCLAAGGGDGNPGEDSDEVAGGLVGFITGILGTACQKGVDAISPKV